MEGVAARRCGTLCHCGETRHGVPAGLPPAVAADEDERAVGGLQDGGEAPFAAGAPEAHGPWRRPCQVSVVVAVVMLVGP